MMIAVLISAMVGAGTVEGDTLSTKSLQTEVAKFYDPPAILLNGSDGTMWQGLVIPVVPIPSHLMDRQPGLDGRKDTSEPRYPTGGIKRNSERPRPKK
jgi:hypothetical protein